MMTAPAVEEKTVLGKEDLEEIDRRVRADLEAMPQQYIVVFDAEHPDRTCGFYLTKYHTKRRIRELIELRKAREESERIHQAEMKTAEAEIAKLYGTGFVVYVGEERLRVFSSFSDVMCPCGEPVPGIDDNMLGAFRYRKAAVEPAEGTAANRLPREFTMKFTCPKCLEGRLVSIQVMP